MSDAGKNKFAERVSIFLLVGIILGIVFFTHGAKAANKFGLHMYYEEPSASSKILIYHQSGNKQVEWQQKKLAYYYSSTAKNKIQVYIGSNSPKYYNKAKNTYEHSGWGCGIYALAHALQWAGGKSVNSNNGGAFLDEFIAICKKPWDYSFVEDAYSSIIKKYGCSWSKSIPSDEAKLKAFFDAGGAIRTNIPGHFQTAVGIAEGKGGETWIHMVDSTCYSTIYRVNDRGYKVYGFSSGKEINKNSISGGGEYWITYKAFKNIFRNKAAITLNCTKGRWYKLTTNEVAVYQGKSTSSSVSTKIPANQGVIITGIYPNKNNPEWYYAEFGNIKGYIRREDLGLISDSDISNVENIGEIKYDKLSITVQSRYSNHWLTAQPYADKDKMIKINKGTQLKVKKVILNNATPRHYWAEVEYNGNIYYACANNLESIQQEEDNDVSISGQVFPKGNLGAPDSFEIRGIVKSKYIITKATGGVYSNNYNYEKTIDVNDTSFDINPSYINKSAKGGIAFKIIPSGTYTFKLVVKYKKVSWINRNRDDQDPIQEGVEVSVSKPEWSTTFTINRGNNVLVTEVKFDISEKTINVGEIFYINKSVKPDNATNKEVTWESSKTSVATVSNGKVTAIGPGTTTITAQANDNSGKKATCTITVRQPVISVTVTPNSKVLYLNETANLTATVMPENASNKEVTWDSNNNNVTVNQNGNITANAVGSATITAKANDGSGKQGTCTVEVRAYVSSITLSGADTVNVGSTISLKPSINPGNAFNKHLDWSSSNTSIATVDDNGNVKGLQAGQVTITAVATDRGTISATKVITVNQPVTSITLSGTNNILKGNTQNIGYTIRPANASNQTLSWSADNPTIATVNNGTVTAKAVGTTDIWAHATDGSGVKAKLTIRVLEPVSEITLNGNHAVSVEGTTTISAVVTPSDAYNKELAWTSDQPAIAAVDNYGTVRGLQTGSAVITATAKDGSGVSVQFAIQVVKQELAVRIEGPNLVHAGNTAQLTAVVTSDEPLSDTSVTWSSGNDSVATVNTDGILTAVSNGTTIITATSNAETYYYAQYQVTVDTLVNKITVSGTKNIDAGSTTLLSASVAPATASNKSLTWTSSNVSVAVTDGNGLVTGIREGTATITAAATDGSGVKGTIKVTVYPLPNQITITGEKDLLVGTTAQMTATVLPSNARNKNVTWTSSDTTVATVNSSGLVTAVGNGTAIITAVASGNGNITENHEVTVTTRVSSVTINAPDRVNAGEMGTITAEVLPETASNQQLNWTSSDEDVAIVDANGNVFGISGGSVIISATTMDGSDIISEIEIEIFQAIQSVSIDIDPIAYMGQQIPLQAIILPKDSSEPYVTWRVNDESIASIYVNTDTDEDIPLLQCNNSGVVRITATSTDGSNVSGNAYIQILPYTELTQRTSTYTLYANGETKNTIGRVSLTTECSVRVAEERHGAVWKIEHISGDYAVALGMNERTFSYNGFTLANGVDLTALGINHTGTDVYRVTCTVNGQPDSCLVTVHVEEPSSPLPTSVTVPTTTYSGLVGETITVNATPVLTPSTSALPEGTERLMVGVDSFNRYAQFNTNGETFNVTFSKAGTYSAIVRYSGTNYSYDAYVTFVITTEAGTLPAEVEEIILNNSLLYMLPGETARFDVSISPSAADDAELIWSSSNIDAVTVAADGTLTAVAPGTATITVAADNGVSANGFVAVVESLLSIDWNPDDVIEVYVSGNSKTVIQRVFLTERASAQLIEAPEWSLKRVDGSNLTLTYEPITATNGNGNTLYGCAIILKSVSDIGTTEYELTCTDGNYSSGTTIKVNANSVENTLPSMVNWQTSTFTGNVNQLLTIYPVVQCWPEGTTLPDEVTISFDGDNYWNSALNRNDFTTSRGIITFSFREPGVYSATCVYAISNMRYLVPVTVRIKDANGNVPVRLMQLTLNETEISVKAGDTVQLNAAFAPNDATNKALTWSSDNPSVATVSADGLVTGITNGRANITCTPADDNCAPVTCVVIVEDTFTVTKYQEMDFQYLQGDVGEPVAGFRMSNGTAKRVKAEGLTPVWMLTRVSGNAADVELREYNGTQFIVVTNLIAGGTDTYQVTCTAGDYTWTGQASLEVHDLGATAPDKVTLAESTYTASVGEEIELDFTPVCEPAGASIPSVLDAEYIGIGDIYSGLADAYQYSLFTAGDRFSLAFKKPGTYLLSRQYRSCNLTYVTECTIIVDDGSLNLIKCTDEDAVIYIGGQSGIASTCIIRDTSIEELYGDQLTWSAERLSGDCMTVALRADQSSASLYVVNAREAGEEVWRVSCTFKGITDYVDITIHAVQARTELPESASLYQTVFDGMIGNIILVPLATECNPEGTSLPVTDDDAWSFSTDGNTKAHAVWSFENNQMKIVFSESGYYGGDLIYQSGNVSYRFPISFAITDEESIQAVPANLAISLSDSSVTVYPEGETQVAIVSAVLTDSLDAYSLASVAAYAERNNATWSVQILSGNSCTFSINSASAAGVQLVLDSITGNGDVTYQIQCSVAGKTVSAQGAVHVATSNEVRPQPEMKQSYFTTPTGTVLSIDASLYDHTHTIKLCSGKDSIWNNSNALAAIGYEYDTSGDLLLPVFYEAGSYVTTITNKIGNLVFTKEVVIAVYSAHALPAAPSRLSFPSALTEIENEAFENVSVNIIDLRGTHISRIGSHAFAGNHDLMRVYIPADVTAISTEAFSGCTDFVICCAEGSYADTWAQSMKYPVVYDME